MSKMVVQVAQPGTATGFYNNSFYNNSWGENKNRREFLISRVSYVLACSS